MCNEPDSDNSGLFLSYSALLLGNGFCFFLRGWVFQSCVSKKDSDQRELQILIIQIPNAKIVVKDLHVAILGHLVVPKLIMRCPPSPPPAS